MQDLSAGICVPVTGRPKRKRRLHLLLLAGLSLVSFTGCPPPPPPPIQVRVHFVKNPLSGSAYAGLEKAKLDAWLKPDPMKLGTDEQRVLSRFTQMSTSDDEVLMGAEFDRNEVGFLQVDGVWENQNECRLSARTTEEKQLGMETQPIDLWVGKDDWERVAKCSVTVKLVADTVDLRTQVKIDATVQDCMVDGSKGGDQRKCEVDEGTPLTLTPKLPRNVRSLGWSVPCLGSTKCVFTCDRARTVSLTVGETPGCEKQFCTEAPFPGLRGLWVRDTTDFWASGDNGFLVHGSPQLQTTSLPGKGLVRALSGQADDVYAVGEGGLIAHRPPTPQGSMEVWNSAKEIALAPSLFGVARNSTTAFAVGSGGVILETTAGKNDWHPVPTPATKNLFAVWADADLAVAVGEGSTIHVKSGTSAWKALSNAPGLLPVSFQGVWGKKTSNGYTLWLAASGASSTEKNLWKIDIVQAGMGWTSLTKDSWQWGTEDLYAVWGDGTTIWAAGKNAIVKGRSDGTKELLFNFPGESFWAITGVAGNPDSVRVAGDLGVFGYVPFAGLGSGASAGSWVLQN